MTYPLGGWGHDQDTLWHETVGHDDEPRYDMTPIEAFTPHDPPANSDQERALHHLQEWGEICPADVGWTSRLAARIYDLRQLGWRIETDRCDNPHHRHTSRVASYRLEG